MIEPDNSSLDSAAAARGGAKRGAPARSPAPAVRPEMVARGRLLAADADYPSLATLRQVSALIVESAEPKQGPR